jgi:hypothetical protein
VNASGVKKKKLPVHEGEAEITQKKPREHIASGSASLPNRMGRL